MHPGRNDVDNLIDEHLALLRQHGQAQTRCSDLLMTQSRAIERLQAQIVRLRAAVIVRDTALAWQAQRHAGLDVVWHGSRRRVVPPREAQQAEEAQADAATTLHVASTVAPVALRLMAGVDDLVRLEDSLVAADLVICQTGCLSHGAYWRVRDHCRRTGKTCVLVEQPDTLRIVRIHPSSMLESPLAPPA